MLELVFRNHFSRSKLLSVNKLASRKNEAKSVFFPSRRQVNVYSFDFIYDLDFLSEEFSLLPIDCEILVNACSSAQNIAINAEM